MRTKRCSCHKHLIFPGSIMTTDDSARRVIRVSSAPSLLQKTLYPFSPSAVQSTSPVGASFLLFKAIVGAGLFAIPYSYKLMGFAGATIALAGVGLLTFYTGVVLIRAHDVIVRDTLRHDMTFVSLTEFCFGRSVSRLVFILLLLSTLGSCGAYIIFMSSVLGSIWQGVSAQLMSSIIALALIPIVLLRNGRVLVCLSAVGNVGVAVVVALTLARGSELANWQPVSSYSTFEPATFMQAFGMIGFLFACAPTLVPIERSMRSNRRYFAAVYLLTTITIILGW